MGLVVVLDECQSKHDGPNLIHRSIECRYWKYASWSGSQPSRAPYNDYALPGRWMVRGYNGRIDIGINGNAEKARTENAAPSAGGEMVRTEKSGNKEP